MRVVGARGVYCMEWNPDSVIGRRRRTMAGGLPKVA